MIRVVQDSQRPSADPIFGCTVPLRWGDMDADGHVNNTLYFRFMEEARMRWVASLGLSNKPPGNIFVVLNAGCAFCRPLVHPADLRVRLYCLNVGRSSLQTAYEIYSSEDLNALCAEGFATMVWFDPLKGKSVPLPEAVHHACKRPPDNS